MSHSTQMNLFSHVKTPKHKTAITSIAAFKQTKEWSGDLRQVALQLLNEAGKYGLTRQALSERMGAKIQSVTPLVHRLIADGVAFENGTTELLASKRWAKVVYHYSQRRATNETC